MDKVAFTYYLVRLCEEQFGPVLELDEWLIYNGESRIPWIDPIFDLPPGYACRVLSVVWVRAEGIGYDPYDNHFAYRLTGLEEHDVIDTTEIIALFELRDEPGTLEEIARRITQPLRAG